MVSSPAAAAGHPVCGLKMLPTRHARWQFSLWSLLKTSFFVAVFLAGMRAIGFERSLGWLASGSCLLFMLGLILLLGVSCVRFANAFEDLLK